MGSPLNGKISNCLVVTGHSLGGGAARLTANAHPANIKGAMGLNPYGGAGNFSQITAPTLLIAGETDTTSAPAIHGKRQYGTLGSIPKQYVEVAGGNHQSALSPNAFPGQYAVAWIKYNVDGDQRFKPFLDKAATGLPAYEQSLP